MSMKKTESSVLKQGIESNIAAIIGEVHMVI